MDPKFEFARRLRAAMRARGWGPTELARRMNEHLAATNQIRAGYSYNWLSAKGLPSGPRRLALCKALGLTEEELIPTGEHRRRVRPSRSRTGSRRPEFADNLRRLMAEKGFRPVDVLRRTRQHLPDGIQVSRQHVQAWQNGAVPSEPRRQALCRALGVSVEELIPPLDPDLHVRRFSRNPQRTAFAKRLNTLMAARELGPTEVSRRMAKYLPKGTTVSREAFWFWRSAKALPSDHLRIALCRALDVSLEELFPSGDFDENT